MATERQIEANRRNALLSTGPKSPGGKETVRGNSTKHGLTGIGAVADEAARATIEARKASWSAEFPRSTPAQEWTFDKLVTASVQLDRAEAAQSVHQSEHGARARAAWDEDRRVEAEEIAARLAKDPSRTVRRLESSPHGIDLMLARWARLGEALDASGDWTESERSHALDLLGLPADLRRGRTPLDPPEGAEAAAFVRGPIYAEIERLNQTRASLAPSDAIDRQYACATHGAELTKSGQLLRRYGREALARFFRHRRELLQAGAASEAAPIRREPTLEAEPASSTASLRPILRALGASPETVMKLLDQEAGPEVSETMACPLTAEDSERALRDVEQHRKRMETAPPMNGTRGKDHPVLSRVAADGTTIVDLLTPLDRKPNRRERRAEKSRMRRA